MLKKILTVSTFLFSLSLFTEGKVELIVFFYLFSFLFAFVVFYSLLFVYNYKIRITSFVKWYWFFIFYSIFHTFIFSSASELSIMMLYRIVVIGILLIAVSNALFYFNLIEPLVWGFSVAILANFLILINIIPSPIESNYGIRFMGTVGNSNVLANMLIAAIGIIIMYLYIYKKNINFLFFVILFAFYCVFLTGSRAGIFMGTLLFFIVFQKTFQGKDFIISRNLVLLFIFASVAMLIPSLFSNSASIEKLNVFLIRFENLLSFSSGNVGDKSVEFRYDYALVALDIFINKIWIGIGLDNFKGIYPIYTHNNYLEIAVGLGVFGLLIYYINYYLLITKTIKAKSNIRYVFLGIIFIRLIIDTTMVSYYLRTVVISFVVMEFLIDKSINKFGKTN